MPSANITHSQSESIAVSSSMPSTTAAVCQSRTHARGSRDQAQDQKSREADTNPRQPGATVSNARNCKRFLASVGLLERTSAGLLERSGAARKDKLLESPNFLCELRMFHLAAGQPCFMRWQNRETARLGIEPEET